MHSSLFRFFLFCLLAAPFNGNSSPPSSVSSVPAQQTVNVIVGDQGFVWKYGHSPSTAEEEKRIPAHLEYVEHILRSRDVSSLPQEMQERRLHLLDLLHAYRVQGNFPHNTDYATERRPCFIDDDGNICAVGYLISQTAGREAAEYINDYHQYEYITEMNDPFVLAWIESSGLTLEECALIQPTYVHPAWAISTGVSYRLTDQFYPVIGAYYNLYHYKTGYYECGGTGAELMWLRKTNFAFALRVAKTYDDNSWWIKPVLAFKPECFFYNATWGMNIYPEAGLAMPLKSFCIHLDYAYAIPVVAGSKYTIGRHAFILRIQWSHTKEDKLFGKHDDRVKF